MFSLHRSHVNDCGWRSRKINQPRPRTRKLNSPPSYFIYLTLAAPQLPHKLHLAMVPLMLLQESECLGSPLLSVQAWLHCSEGFTVQIALYNASLPTTENLRRSWLPRVIYVQMLLLTLRQEKNGPCSRLVDYGACLRTAKALLFYTHFSSSVYPIWHVLYTFVCQLCDRHSYNKTNEMH